MRDVRSPRAVTCGALALLSLLTACSRGSEQNADATTPATTAAAAGLVSGDSLVAKTGVGAGKITIPGADPEDGQWLRPAKDYASTRYSGLDQINATNASRIALAWSFSTGVLRGQEAAPLVVGSTMYVVTPYPNILYALDLTKPGGPAKWKYEPQPLAAAQCVACCDVVNRGAAFADGKIFYNTLDNQTVAVDANTGKEVWRTQLGDINNGETITMARLVVKGKVLVGNSGGELVTGGDVVFYGVSWRSGFR